jgi:hypothetical protein
MKTSTITHAQRATVFFKQGMRWVARYQFANIDAANKYLADLGNRVYSKDETKVEMRPYSPIVKFTPERKSNMAHERTKGIEQSPCSKNLAQNALI